MKGPNSVGIIEYLDRNAEDIKNPDKKVEIMAILGHVKGEIEKLINESPNGDMVKRHIGRAAIELQSALEAERTK